MPLKAACVSDARKLEHFRGCGTKGAERTWLNEVLSSVLLAAAC